MHLWTPKAPSAPAPGTPLRFHFATDDTRNLIPINVASLADATATVAAELARLRAVIAEGRGARSVRVVRDALVTEYAALAQKSGALGNARQRAQAGIATVADVMQAQAAYDASYARQRTLHAERLRVEQAEAAILELDRLMTAVA